MYMKKTQKIRALGLAMLMSGGLLACSGASSGPDAEIDCDDCANEPAGTLDDGHDDLDSDDDLDVEGEVLKAQFPTGSGCTTLQRRAIRDAEARAVQYVNSILNRPIPPGTVDPLAFMLNAGMASPVIRGFFAPANLTEMEYVFRTYARIGSSASFTDHLCRAGDHPDCTQDINIYARTSVTSSAIRWCPAFFGEPLRHQAQLMIHELSHQNRTSTSNQGTADLVGASIRNAYSYDGYAPRCFEGNCGF